MARVRGGGESRGGKGGAGGKAGAGGRGGRKLARRAGGGTLPSMWSLVKAAVLLGALAAFLFLVPFGGRTLADRWRAADDATDFAARTWAEMRGDRAPDRAPPRPGGKVQARAGAKPAGPAPVEGHTEADRRALDRLLDQHLADAPRR